MVDVNMSCTVGCVSFAQILESGVEGERESCFRVMWCNAQGMAVLYKGLSVTKRLASDGNSTLKVPCS